MKNPWLVKHGFYGTSFYRRWQGIKTRCENTKHVAYHRYGGRGIKHTWPKFQDFLKDMHTSYVEHVLVHGQGNTKLDRVNNDGPYSKKNCRWVTARTNSRNRNNNTFLTFDGKTLCVKEWSEVLKCDDNTLLARLKMGWSVEETLTTPIKNI